MNKTTRNVLKFKTKTKIARYFVNNFPTNVLKSITFLHPMGVCGWTFHRTAFGGHCAEILIPLFSVYASLIFHWCRILQTIILFSY